MIASTVSVKALRFTRVARQQLPNTGRTSVIMSAETLDRSTPDSKWKELLTAEEVRSPLAVGAFQPQHSRLPLRGDAWTMHGSYVPRHALIAR